MSSKYNIMNSPEKDALTAYLDFLLLSYVEKFEKHVDGIVSQQMYDDAYALIVDIDNTLSMQIAITEAVAKGKEKKS